MFLKNIFAIALAAMLSVSAFAKGSSHVDEVNAAIRYIGVPCTIRINDSIWVNAKAVSHVIIQEWNSNFHVYWYFGKGYAYIQARDYNDAVNWIKWYNREVENKCK